MGDILVAKCSSYYYSTLYKRFPKATEEKSKSQQSERSLHVSMSLWSHLQHFQLLIYTLVMSMYLKFSHTLLHSLACFACAVCSVRKAFFPWLTHSSIDVHLKHYLFRDWPSTLDRVPFCVLKALCTYIHISNPASTMTYT